MASPRAGKRRPTRSAQSASRPIALHKVAELGDEGQAVKERPPVGGRLGVVDAEAMKRSKGILRKRRLCTPPARRHELLAAFDRSGLSAAAFAREQGIRYTTFCGWRHRQATPRRAPAFVEVEGLEGARPVELGIELGAHAQLRLTSTAQMELAACLLHRFNLKNAPRVPHFREFP